MGGGKAGQRWCWHFDVLVLTVCDVVRFIFIFSFRGIWRWHDKIKTTRYNIFLFEIISRGRRVRRGSDTKPDEVITADLRDYGTELPAHLGVENFTTTHNTSFSVGLVNFTVQTLIGAFEKQKGGIWGIQEFINKKLAEREGGTWISDIRPSKIEHSLN